MVSVESCLSECTVSIVYLNETFLSPRFIANPLSGVRDTRPHRTRVSCLASSTALCPEPRRPVETLPGALAGGSDLAASRPISPVQGPARGRLVAASAGSVRTNWVARLLGLNF